MVQGLRQLGRTLSIVGCLTAAAPAWSQESASMTSAQARSAPLFMISYRPGPKWQPGVPMRDQGLRDHFHYMKKLDGEGRILLAGPVGEDSGLVLVRAADQAAAAAVITDDPAVKAGLFVGDARLFVPSFVGEMPKLNR